MTSPPREITVTCAGCGAVFKDWYRASINLMLDDFDEEYVRKATSVTCPSCGWTAGAGALVVSDSGDWVFDVP